MVSTTNTICQVENDKITPPKAGANTGATPLTNMSKAKNFVNCLPLYKSLDIALEITAPAPPQNLAQILNDHPPNIVYKNNS